jgi:hypothetical protein
MKTPFKVLALLLLTVPVAFTSCKKDHADPDKSANAGDSKWTFAGYTYERGTSAQLSSAQDDKTLTAITVSTTGDGGNHGAFSGSALVFSFYSDLGTGNYTLANSEIMVSNPGAKVIAITCTIGTAVATGATLYTPTVNSTATAEVTKDADGQFHITLSTPVTLTRDVEVSGGVSGAKDTYPLTIHNAY